MLRCVVPCLVPLLLAYVDVVAPMLGKDGQPRKELLVKDGLHLSPAGYKLWAELVRPHLK